MSRPNVDQLDRDALDDLGLIEDDNTPDMRRAPAATEALRKNDHHIHITEQEI